MNQTPIQSSIESEMSPQVARPVYRGLPSVAFLRALVTRNLLLAIVVGAIYSPLALVLVLSTLNEYSSGVVLKHNTDSEAIDSDPMAGSRFPPLISTFMSPPASEDFYLELARRYEPPPRPSPLAKLPVVGPLHRLVFEEKPVQKQSPKALLMEAASLRERVNMVSEGDYRTASIAILTAVDTTPERAQLLALTAANLLLDKFYLSNVKRVEAAAQTLGGLLQLDQVKAMVERAISAARKEEKSTSKRPDQNESLDVRIRQHAIQEKIKDLTIRIQESRERKVRLETEISTLALRYGSYHPQIKGLQAQLSELNAADKQKQLSSDLSRMQDEYLTLEAEAASLGMSDRDGGSESVDKVVQRLGVRLDRYNLELLSLKNQLEDPSRRTRLQMVGPPSLPFLPTKAQKGKKAMLLGAVGLALIVGTVVAREVVGGRAQDPWTISWAIQLPCLASFTRRARRALPRLDPETIRGVRAQMLGSKAEARRARPLLLYRQLAHWLRNKANGNVILFVKASEQPRCSGFIHDLVNVYSCDYSGRYLVIDLDGRDGLVAQAAPGGGGNILEFIARRMSWKEICLPRDQRRAFDLIAAPSPSDRRIADLLGSPGLAELIASAQKVYKAIFLVGLGPEQFVENTALLAVATDCLLVVESPSTTFQHLRKLTAHLDADKIAGYVQLEA